MNDPEAAGKVPLKRSSVIAVVLLSLLTGGIYTSVWYLRRRKGLNSLDSSSKLGLAGPLILLASTIGYFMTPRDSIAETLVALAVGIINIAMAFRVRWMIIDHLTKQIAAVIPLSGSLQSQYNPSSILTFFLNIWYLQYKINELVEVSGLWARSSGGEASTT